MDKRITREVATFLEGVTRALDFARSRPDREGPPSIVVNLSVLVFQGDVLIKQEIETMGDKITVSHVQNSIVNIKGALNGASLAINAAPIDSSKKDELKALIAQLETALTKVAKVAPEKSESAEAVGEAAKDTMEKVSKDKPNKKSIEVSAKGMLEAAKDVAEALPIATKIASVIAGMFGFSL
jgi:hypothetical protein